VGHACQHSRCAYAAGMGAKRSVPALAVWGYVFYVPSETLSVSLDRRDCYLATISTCHLSISTIIRTVDDLVRGRPVRQLQFA
jgi:hypothetical protein